MIYSNTFKNFLKFLIILLIFGLPVVFFNIVKQESLVCDELVELVDGTTIQCTGTYSYDSGMTTLLMCNGQIKEIPTIRIKEIRHE